MMNRRERIETTANQVLSILLLEELPELTASSWEQIEEKMTTLSETAAKIAITFVNTVDAECDKEVNTSSQKNPERAPRHPQGFGGQGMPYGN